jgi:hypothetical protein
MVFLEILMVIAAILIIAVMVLAIVAALATFSGHDRFREVDVDSPDRSARVGEIVASANINRDGPSR